MGKRLFLRNLLVLVAAATLSAGITSCKDDKDPTLKLNKYSLEFNDAGGQNSEIIVTAVYTDWSVVVENGGEWLSATKNGNTIAVKAEKNADPAERNGQLAITATENPQLRYTVSVKQKGATPYISINGTDKATPIFPGKYDGGKSGIDYKQEYKITSNVQWTLNGVPDWLNVSPTSGKGELTLSIYPTSENDAVEDRKATITMLGTGASSIYIEAIQRGGRSDCYVIPSDVTTLYDRICWEFSATSTANNFQYLLLSEQEYARLADYELEQELAKEEVKKYSDGWLIATGYDSRDNRIKSNSVYYCVSIATDMSGKSGALRKVKITTPAYLDADQDAYVNFSDLVSNSYQFQFNVNKMGRCDSYHLIYGIDNDYNNTAVFAFAINYYLKHNKKHWISKNSYYEWEIVTNYPNDHTFTYTSLYLTDFPIWVGYGWGIFKDGTLSSDLLGFQYDSSSESAPQLKVKRETTPPKMESIKREELMQRLKTIRKQ